MRILMTTDTVGGVWTFTRELADGLLNSGCAVALVSLGRQPSGEQRAWADNLTHDWKTSFRYEGLDTPLEWMPQNESAYSGVAPILMKMARDFQPDLLHSNQFCFGALPLKVPKIITAHSDVLSWAESCRDGKLEDSAWLRQYLDLVKRGLAGADCVVAPTRWMLHALARNFLLPESTAVVSNGRTLGATPSAAHKLQAVTAGRLWDEAKNISILRKVRSSIPLLVAGEAHDGFDAATGHLTSLGPLSENDLLTLFRESSIYICTSRYEPFGLAPLEAALCGCAVLANDIASLREVWSDGALYFSGAESLGELLRDLCDNPEQLRAARIQSFQRAGLFTGQRMIKGYLQVFQSALARLEAPAYVA
ncbi:MAG TPA: glycosyltransferase family 4 protein [Acidobacteriaceae bacterium]|nr:glycosyltransferase family 4 protein [Acidobacteriaceae bacterium]